MNYPHLASRLYNVPLMISRAKLEVIERVFRAHVEGTAPALPKFTTVERPEAELAAIGGAQRTQGGYLRTGDGIALIQVLGSLVQRTGGMDAESGLQSYANIEGMLNAALSDPMVRGILLEIDSDGGEGPGLFELAARISAIDAVKPVTAHANEKAFSAAYALAASAGELFVAPTGMVGSIGVRMMHVDQSSYDAKRGLVYTEITYGDRKADFSPHAPISDAALTAAQDMVDRLGQTFVSHVALSRDIDEQVVIGTQAGILHPDQALQNGMIDDVATLSQAADHLRKRMNVSRGSPPFYTSATPGAQHKEQQTMAQVQTPGATAAAGTITPEQLAAERAAGVAEGRQAATVEASAAAAAAQTAERARVAGILGHAEAAGRRKQAEHLAFKTNSTIEEAASLLAASAKEAEPAKDPLRAAMDGVKNPQLGADDTTETTTKTSIDHNKIYAARKAAIRAVK